MKFFLAYFQNQTHLGPSSQQIRLQLRRKPLGLAPTSFHCPQEQILYSRWPVLYLKDIYVFSPRELGIILKCTAFQEHVTPFPPICLVSWDIDEPKLATEGEKEQRDIENDYKVPKNTPASSAIFLLTDFHTPRIIHLINPVHEQPFSTTCYVYPKHH